MQMSAFTLMTKKSLDDLHWKNSNFCYAESFPKGTYCFSCEKYSNNYTIIIFAVVICVYWSNYKIWTSRRGTTFYSRHDYVHHSIYFFLSIQLMCYAHNAVNARARNYIQLPKMKYTSKHKLFPEISPQQWIFWNTTSRCIIITVNSYGSHGFFLKIGLTPASSGSRRIALLRVHQRNVTAIS